MSIEKGLFLRLACFKHINLTDPPVHRLMICSQTLSKPKDFYYSSGDPKDTIYINLNFR